MTADRMVVALVLAGIAGGAVASSYALHGLLNLGLRVLDRARSCGDLDASHRPAAEMGQ